MFFYMVFKKPNKCSHLTQIATRLFGVRVAHNIPERHVTICAGATGVMRQSVQDLHPYFYEGFL